MSRVHLVAAACILLIAGGAYFTGRIASLQVDRLADLRRDIATLEQRLDIERGEREELARQIRTLSGVVYRHDAELSLQAGAIEMLEEETRATDDEVEREWPRTRILVSGRAHP